MFTCISKMYLKLLHLLRTVPANRVVFLMTDDYARKVDLSKGY